MTLQGVSHRLMTQTQRRSSDESQLWLQQFPTTRYVGIHIVLCMIASHFSVNIRLTPMFSFGQCSQFPTTALGCPNNRHDRITLTLRYVFSVYLESDGANILARPYRWQRTNELTRQMLESRQLPGLEAGRTADRGWDGPDGGCVLFWAGAANEQRVSLSSTVHNPDCSFFAALMGKTNPRTAERDPREACSERLALL